ncbi:hypothetical protein DSOUD_2770 [Desulfuromonas soudanensis]|uniref:Uncharacterized protein n=1 Tax=Desulfuromonas soudanensis TaxID=1603606 RepID=A0A0M4D324_9BACT|nr:hypothetical protein [Desulfuromonas soudanensis]ALC17508.1 hypothetical protein DSOUD_2770 [Desulfuromonas soudanensis]
MRVNLIQVFYIFIFIMLIGTSAYALTNFSKATIVVLDERNDPIDGAYTGITFETNTGQGTKVSTGDGSTNLEGKFTATGSCNGHISYGAKKEGYYDSYYVYDFKEKNSFGWEPWNPELKVVLRKIENPVPMYARRAKIEIPVAGKEIGFDLVKYDWVIPYGKGTIGDFTVYLDMDDKGGNDYEYKFKIYFPEKYDGFYTYDEEIEKGSSFKLPRIADMDGYYDKEINILMVGLKRGSKLSWKNNRHYIFRVRSEEKHGKFTRGMYGKIFSDIKLLTARKKGGIPSLSFTYYLNPDFTRNLEFDPKRNLFGNLPDSERVTEP